MVPEMGDVGVAGSAAGGDDAEPLCAGVGGGLGLGEDGGLVQQPVAVDAGLHALGLAAVAAVLRAQAAAGVEQHAQLQLAGRSICSAPRTRPTAVRAAGRLVLPARRRPLCASGPRRPGICRPTSRNRRSARLLDAFGLPILIDISFCSCYHKIGII